MAQERKELKLEDGKVYLRDTRNGRVHQYEDTLAQMGYMKRFVAGEEETPQTQELTASGFNVSLTGLERAAEWDRRAALTPEQRAAEDKKASTQAEATQAAAAKAAETTASGQPATTQQTAAQPAAAPAAPQAPTETQTTASGSPSAPPAPPAPPAKADDGKK